MSSENKKNVFFAALIIGLVIQFFGALGYFVVFGDSVVAHWLYLGTKVFLIVVPPFFLSMVGLTRSTFFSVDRRSLWWGLGTGLLIGLVVLLAFFGFQDTFLSVAETVQEKITSFGLGVYFIPFALFVSIVHSGIEEYYWRGFIFGGLKTYISPVWAMVVSSFAFASHHFIIVHEFFSVGVSVCLTLAVAIGGLIWCWLYQKTGKLVASWLSHAIVDGFILSIVYLFYL